MSSEAASHKLAQRAGALQEAMQVWVRECDFWTSSADIPGWCRLLASGATTNPKTVHIVFTPCCAEHQLASSGHSSRRRQGGRWRSWQPPRVKVWSGSSGSTSTSSSRAWQLTKGGGTAGS